MSARTPHRLQPAPLTHAPALAWLMAHAYARRSSFAVLAYPVALVITVLYAARRGVYESPDRHGMVIVTRWRLALDVALAVALFVLIGAVLLLLAVLLTVLVHPLLAPAVTGLSGMWLVVGALVLTHGQQSATPIAKDTPTSGDRWQVAALAQRPGTRFSALLLTRQVITHVVPPGDVLVASAGSDKLEQAYVRAGFIPLGHRRLYRIA